jgi:hypothetical protein
MNELLKDMKERGETEESDSQSYSSPWWWKQQGPLKRW